MIKIGIGGIALTMLSACGNGTPDYDATGTFEATEVTVSAEAARQIVAIWILEEGTAVAELERKSAWWIPLQLYSEKTTTGG